MIRFLSSQNQPVAKHLPNFIACRDYLFARKKISFTLIYYQGTDMAIRNSDQMKNYQPCFWFATILVKFTPLSTDHTLVPDLVSNNELSHHL